MIKHSKSQFPLQSTKSALLNNKGLIQLRPRQSQATKPTNQFIQSQQGNTQRLLNQKKSVIIKQKSFTYIEQIDRKSQNSSTTTQQYVKFKKNISNNQQISQNQKSFKYQVKQNYDVSDITFTLMDSKIKAGITVFLFFMFIGIRYYTFACCIYISKNSQHWVWIILFCLTRFVFVILVIKVSLKIPQTKTQLVLKTYFNSMVNDGHEYFQFVSFKKMFWSILRGFVPCQLSFLYIQTNNIRRRYAVFTAINYIFVSIEQIVFYPFFIIYSLVLAVDNQFSLNQYYSGATVIISLGGFVIFIIFTIYLLLVGVKKKYGSFRYYLKYKPQKKVAKNIQSQLSFHHVI